jgi:hypothetical protein
MQHWVHKTQDEDKQIKTKRKQINVREYRSDNQQWTIQRNWQHRVNQIKTNKTKHNTICVGLYDYCLDTGVRASGEFAHTHCIEC